MKAIRIIRKEHEATLLAIADNEEHVPTHAKRSSPITIKHSSIPSDFEVENFDDDQNQETEMTQKLEAFEESLNLSVNPIKLHSDLEMSRILELLEDD
ncbi:MAG: hypothetical protein NT027_00920 [Proteobacteria bacterium]|nr:hypothetical protein [Pseudomonadota bacterium]